MGAVLTHARSLALGIACGSRSMAGLTALAFNRGWQECAGRVPAPLGLMRSDLGRLVLAAASLGELIVDKTPLAPPRTKAGPLGGRIFFGALTGFLSTRSIRSGHPSHVAFLGVLLGGGGAAVAAFAGAGARHAAATNTDLPDLPVALIEDALTCAIATTAARA